MRNIFSALSLFLLAALAAVPVAHAAVVFQIEYLRSSLQGGCGPILGNDVQDVLITVFVPLGNVQNLKCPRPLYAASMATAKCQIADGSTDSAYGIRTWCIEGLTMPMSSNGIYGWVTNGAVPKNWLEAPFAYQKLYFYDTTTCPRRIVAGIGAKIKVSEIVVTRDYFRYGCEDQSTKVCANSGYKVFSVLANIQSVGANSQGAQCGPLGKSPLRVSIATPKKTTSTKKKVTTTKKKAVIITTTVASTTKKAASK